MKKIILMTIFLGSFLFIGSVSKAKAQEGCSNYLGRPNEKLCTTQKGFDACVVLLKEGKVNYCSLTSNPNVQIRRASSAEAEAALAKKDCVKIGNGMFNCGDGKSANSKAAYNNCLSYKNFGAVKRCVIGEDLDMVIVTGAGEFIEKQRLLKTGDSSLKLAITGIPTETQKIIWKITSEQISETTNWQNPKGLLASGEINSDKSGYANLNIDLSKALGKPTNTTRRIFIKSFAVSNSNLIATPAQVVVDYVIVKSVEVKIESTNTNSADTSPKISSSITLVKYLPPIFNTDTCAFVLTKMPAKGEYKLVLEKIGVTKVGTKFRLCEAEFEKIKKNFSLTEKISLTLQEILQFIKKAYNWLDSKYNLVESMFIEKLTPLLGKDNAYKVLNAFKLAYGYKPYYGNFDDLMDNGRAALKAFINQYPDADENSKKQAISQVDNFTNQIKFYANGGDDQNQFFRLDPNAMERPAIVYLQVTYAGKNNPSANMTGGSQTIDIEIMSGKYVDKNSPGLAPYPPIRLFLKQKVMIPAGKPGQTITIPVVLDYAPTRKNEPILWGNGWSSSEEATITIGSINGSKYKVMVQKEFQK